jgi:Skp family chaperone for outer membrane proteins
MTILGITLLVYSLGAAFPTQNPVNKQAAPDIAKDGGPKIVLFNNSALSQFKMPQSDIDALQSKFTKDNHVDLLLDLAELTRNGLVLWWIPEVDVTKTFVEACREYKKTGAMLVIKTTIPKASIAILNMQAIFDGKTGIKQVAKRIKEAYQKFPKAYTSASEKEAFDKYLKEGNGPIFEALEAFAKERGFNFVFNSSAQPNLSIYSLPSTDITRLFIDKYNRLHP